MEPATPKIRNRRYRWLREGATPDRCETRKATLPDRLRLYRKNRWLRGHATPDFCDWSREPFPVWLRRWTAALRRWRPHVRIVSGAPFLPINQCNSGLRA